MSTVNISLPDPMKQFVEQRVASGSYGTVSEYIRELIRLDQKQTQEEALERKLLDGLNSGTPIKGDAKYWEKKKAQLAVRLARGSRR